MPRDNPPYGEISQADDAWRLTGPTASCKTRVALALAELSRSRGRAVEIISMDSMALFRGMDIGTAKPTAKDRRATPHHLLDVVEPSQDFSLASYLTAARDAVAGIRARGAQPLFVGGTPLYLKGLLRGVFEGPPADWEFRRQLEDEAKERGENWLWRRLSQVDPAAAAKLHANDTRRLIRALEVHAKTGRPISDWQRQFNRARRAEECRVFVLDWPREMLYERINRRVDDMFEQGLVDEVRRLTSEGRQLSRTARQALGYREVLEFLEGRATREETIDLVKRRTRQFARRQLTWFRSLSECRFVRLENEADLDRAAADILARALEP